MFLVHKIECILEVKSLITKEQLKSEIEGVPDEYIHVLYKIIHALKKSECVVPDKDWLDFIEQTYGCMQENPICRGEQGVFEIRKAIQ